MTKHTFSAGLEAEHVYKIRRLSRVCGPESFSGYGSRVLTLLLSSKIQLFLTPSQTLLRNCMQFLSTPRLQQTVYDPSSEIHFPDDFFLPSSKIIYIKI